MEEQIRLILSSFPMLRLVWEKTNKGNLIPMFQYKSPKTPLTLDSLLYWANAVKFLTKAKPDKMQEYSEKTLKMILYKIEFPY